MYVFFSLSYFPVFKLNTLVVQKYFKSRIHIDTELVFGQKHKLVTSLTEN